MGNEGDFLSARGVLEFRRYLPPVRYNMHKDGRRIPADLFLALNAYCRSTFMILIYNYAVTSKHLANKASK